MMDYKKLQTISPHELYKKLDETCMLLFKHNTGLTMLHENTEALDGRKAASIRELTLDTTDPGCQTIIQRARSNKKYQTRDYTIIKIRDYDLGATQLLIEDRANSVFIRRLYDDINEKVSGMKVKMLEEAASNITLWSAITRVNRGQPIVNVRTAQQFISHPAEHALANEAFGPAAGSWDFGGEGFGAGSQTQPQHA